MTRKDYEKIANVLYFSAIELNTSETANIIYADLINSMADMLANDNPRFNRLRFIAACTPEE